MPIRAFAEILATLIKLNVLAPASFGLLALVSGASSGLGTGIDLGTTRALPKYIPETDKAGGPPATLRLLGAVFVAQVLALLAVVAGLLLFRGAYLGGLARQLTQDAVLSAGVRNALLHYIETDGWLIIGAIVALLFLGICYDMLMAYLNSFFRQKTWNAVDLAAKLLLPLLSAAAIVISRLTGAPEGWAITGVLIAMVVAPLVSVMVAGWQVWRAWGERQKPAVSSQQSAAKPSSLHPFIPPGFVRYCAVSFLMTTSDFIASPGFAIFLAKGIGDVALLWAGSSVVRMVLGYLFTPMVGVQVPLFTRVRAGDGGTLNGAYQSLVRLQLLLLIPGGVGLMLLARPTLAILTPSYLDAAPLVWVLVPALFLECLLTTAHNALIVYEKLGIIIISRLLTLAVVAALAFWLPGAYGIVGVALAFGAARVVAGAWVTGSGFRLLGLVWPWRFTARVLLASGAMALAIAGLNGRVPLGAIGSAPLARLAALPLLLGIGGLGGAVFLLVLRLAGGLERADREQLARLRLPAKQWIMRLV